MKKLYSVLITRNCHVRGELCSGGDTIRCDELTASDLFREGAGVPDETTKARCTPACEWREPRVAAEGYHFERITQ